MLRSVGHRHKTVYRHVAVKEAATSQGFVHYDSASECAPYFCRYFVYNFVEFNRRVSVSVKYSCKYGM